jgi:hypothetical protein
VEARDREPARDGLAGDDESGLGRIEGVPSDFRASASAGQATSPSAAPREIESRADAAVASLRGAIDAPAFSGVAYDRQARVLAGDLRSAVGGDDALRALRKIAGEATRDDRDAIAASTLIRVLVGSRASELPGNALGALRRSWLGRAGDPTRALAAAGALARFGDALDRGAMLDSVVNGEREPAYSLAFLGLSAARGDGPAIELAEAVEAGGDPRRRDLALCALTSLVSWEDSGLSTEGRLRCGELLRREMEKAGAQGERPARLVAALAVLEPAEAAKVLFVVLADPGASEAEAQGVASRLGTMPCATQGLRAFVVDTAAPEIRRLYAAEALMRAEEALPVEARILLEALSDRAPNSPSGRRAREVLERADGKTSPGVGDDPRPGLGH